GSCSTTCAATPTWSRRSPRPASSRTRPSRHCARRWRSSGRPSWPPTAPSRRATSPPARTSTSSRSRSSGRSGAEQMGAQQRIYKQRIRSTQTLKKMFRAMELIAASRIGQARDRAVKASPYERAITRAVSAVATHGDVDHPLTTERTNTNRVAMLVVTADRGQAGAYSASVLREAEQLRLELEEQGKEVA